MNSVYVLTSQHNDYNQHGEYFLAVFSEKPTAMELAKILCSHGIKEASIKLAAHILRDGGRRENEEVWYFLREEPFSDCRAFVLRD